MENAMLTFDNVSAHYGKIQALHNVSLHIKQGESVTLIGANGAGQTTLLGTLCGDPRASSGRIVFDGKDITDANREDHARGGGDRSGRAARLFAYDGGREPGDGRFFCRPRSVPDPHQMGV